MSEDEHTGADEYDAEQAVDLRSQRLRVPKGPEPPTPVPDPYGVGQAALADAAATGNGSGPVSNDLLADAAGVETDPATWGWRGRANAAVGLRLRPRAGSGELSYRQAVERARQPLAGIQLVTVANPKGGQGNTPATVLLANTFATHRGGGVVAWDANESRGTLASRAAVFAPSEYTVWDVLEHAGTLCSPHADASSLARFLHVQPTKDEVLASDRSGTRLETVGVDECAAIMAVLRRHRSMVIADTSNNDRSQAFRWVVEHSNQLVVPLTYRRDATYEVLRMFDGLAARGFEHLIHGAVVVLVRGTAPTATAERAVERALEAAGVLHLAHVPFDDALASGERIVYSRLAPTTVQAWTEVAALVADGLATSAAERDMQLESTFVPQSRPTPAEYDERPGRIAAGDGRYPRPVTPYRNGAVTR